jgi:hypothetical protein
MRRLVALMGVLAVGLLGLAAPGRAQWLSPLDVPQRSLGATEVDRLELSAPAIDSPSLLGLLSGVWIDSAATFGLGVGVHPLRGDRGVTPPSGPTQSLLGPYRLLEDRSTAISFDLRLRWPSPLDLHGAGVLQPYAAVGPALLLAEPAAAAQVLYGRADTGLALGVRAGAGVTWEFDRNTAFFSEYRFIRAGRDSHALGVRGSGSQESSGFDLLYGVRFRF